MPAQLRKFCDGAAELPVSAGTVRAALADLEREHPSLYVNLCDETGALRRHLNVFVNSSHVRDRAGLEDGEPGEAPFRAVLAQEPDAVAGLHALALEHAREGMERPRGLGEAQRLPSRGSPAQQERGIAVALVGEIQQLGKEADHRGRRRSARG